MRMAMVPQRSMPPGVAGAVWRCGTRATNRQNQAQVQNTGAWLLNTSLTKMSTTLSQTSAGAGASFWAASHSQNSETIRDVRNAGTSSWGPADGKRHLAAAIADNTPMRVQ